MFCTNILVKSRKYRIFLCIIYKFIPVTVSDAAKPLFTLSQYSELS